MHDKALSIHRKKKTHKLFFFGKRHNKQLIYAANRWSSEDSHRHGEADLDSITKTETDTMPLLASSQYQYRNRQSSNCDWIPLHAIALQRMFYSILKRIQSIESPDDEVHYQQLLVSIYRIWRILLSFNQDHKAYLNNIKSHFAASDHLTQADLLKTGGTQQMRRKDPIGYNYQTTKQ